MSHWQGIEGAIHLNCDLGQPAHCRVAFTSQLSWERTMSIFGKIMGAIFGSSASAAPAGGTATSAAPAGGSSSASPSPAAVPAGAAPAQSVDVAPILDKAVAAK